MYGQNPFHDQPKLDHYTRQSNFVKPNSFHLLKDFLKFYYKVDCIRSMFVPLPNGDKQLVHYTVKGQKGCAPCNKGLGSTGTNSRHEAQICTKDSKLPGLKKLKELKQLHEAKVQKVRQPSKRPSKSHCKVSTHLVKAASSKLQHCIQHLHRPHTPVVVLAHLTPCQGISLSPLQLSFHLVWWMVVHQSYLLEGYEISHKGSAWHLWPCPQNPEQRIQQVMYVVAELPKVNKDNDQCSNYLTMWDSPDGCAHGKRHKQGMGCSPCIGPHPNLAIPGAEQEPYKPIPVVGWRKAWKAACDYDFKGKPCIWKVCACVTCALPTAHLPTC